MSFKRTPFHFNDVDRSERRAELLKRFGLRPEEDMFFDTSSMRQGWPEWESRPHRPPQFDESYWKTDSGSESGSPRLQHRIPKMNWGMDDSIPVKIVHENARRSNAGSDDTTDSETSSQGSGQNVKTQKSHEPRVHHIPIMVEPRDGSTSSGYGSDGIADDFTHRPSRSNFSKNSNDSDTKSGNYQAKNNFASKNYQSSPSQHFDSESTATDSQGSNSNFRQIPIVLEKEPFSKPSTFSKKSHTHPNVSRSSSGPTPQDRFQETQPTVVRSASGPNTSKQKEYVPSTADQAGINKQTARKPANGPYVTKISVNKDTAQPQSQPNNPKLQPIAAVQKEVQDLRDKVDHFVGSANDKYYRYLDEMLTRCLLKLDNIDTEGIEEIRQARKAAIRDVQLTLSILESRSQKPESMQVDESKESTPVPEQPMEITESNQEQPESRQQSSEIPVTQMDAVQKENPVSEVNASSKLPSGDSAESQGVSTSNSQEMPLLVPEPSQEKVEVPESQKSQETAAHLEDKVSTIETSQPMESDPSPKDGGLTNQVTEECSNPQESSSPQCNNEQTRL